jgi:hypothetical protein
MNQIYHDDLRAILVGAARLIWLAERFFSN